MQESKELVLLDKFGHFDSDHCYLTEFYHSGRHELYLWVGSLVKWDAVNVNAMDVVTAHIKEASGHCQLVSVHTGQAAVSVYTVPRCLLLLFTIVVQMIDCCGVGYYPRR